MKYKYRIFAAGFLVAVILLGSLAGCGKSAEAETEGVQQFQFKDKELQLVAFEFRNTEENGDLSKFFTKVLDELTKLYGDYQENVNKESEIGLMEGYKWLIENDDGSRNTMQLISYTKNEEVKIILGMGYIPERSLLTDDPQI